MLISQTWPTHPIIELSYYEKTVQEDDLKPVFQGFSHLGVGLSHKTTQRSFPIPTKSFKDLLGFFSYSRVGGYTFLAASRSGEGWNTIGCDHHAQRYAEFGVGSWSPKAEYVKFTDFPNQIAEDD